MVHLCFGNSGGQRIPSGGWDGLMNYPNSLHVAHIVIECRNWPGDGLAVFRDLWLEIGVGLGVVDVKVTEVESAEQIAQDLEWAATMLGDGRVTHVYPDFGFWMLKRLIADANIRALAAGCDFFEGR